MVFVGLWWHPKKMSTESRQLATGPQDPGQVDPWQLRLVESSVGQFGIFKWICVINLKVSKNERTAKINSTLAATHCSSHGPLLLQKVGPGIAAISKGTPAVADQDKVATPNSHFRYHPHPTGRLMTYLSKSRSDIYYRRLTVHPTF